MGRTDTYQPVFEITRGEIVESMHYGAIAVVDVYGNLVAYYGDPNVVTYMRSTAKPMQVLPFIERGGVEAFNLSPGEIAVMCSSHSGTDDHIEAICSAQRKTGVKESDLLCGIHNPLDEVTNRRMQTQGILPTANRHNCSGMHTALVANDRMLGLHPQSNVKFPKYVDREHPIQQEILEVVAYMCAVEKDQIVLGVDGCSVPTFGVPLRNAALAYARLCDPDAGGVAPYSRVFACGTIHSAMISNPELVAGTHRFDTLLMQVGNGRILSKGGAEGYQGIGITTGVRKSNSPTLGIAIKIADGSGREQVRPAVALEVLRQLDLLTGKELEYLSDTGPEYQILNCREQVVGEGRPAFVLKWVGK